MALGLLVGGAATAHASTPAPAAAAAPTVVDVVKVSGYLDPVLVDYVEQAIADAEHGGSLAVVLQLDSPGALVSRSRLDRLVSHVRDASVLVGVWVGPSGAEASAAAGRIVAAAELAGVAPGSTVEIDGRRMGASEALDKHVADFAAPTLGDFVVNIPGVDIREVEEGDETRRELAGSTTVRFAQLPLLPRLMHTVASPAIAYLLFVIGLGLIVFELFTAGVGVAGAVGAGSFVLGCYGFAVLPTRPLGIFLLVLGMFGFSVDVQTGVPRVWTGIATIAFAAGSLVIYDGITLSWITLLVAVVGMVLAMIGGMPAMVRSRFSTPTIGREWMVGEVGTARTAIAPEGVVMVRDARWKARTNRATPLAAGDPVRVAAIDGLLLQVEPLEGAARDYRESARSGRPQG